MTKTKKYKVSIEPVKLMCSRRSNVTILGTFYHFTIYNFAIIADSSHGFVVPIHCTNVLNHLRSLLCLLHSCSSKLYITLAFTTSSTFNCSSSKMTDTKFLVSSPEPLIIPPAQTTLPEYLLDQALKWHQNGKSYYAVDATSKEKRYFGEFENESRKIANALHKLGLRKGNYVLYLPSEIIKLHIFLSGVWRANGICRASYSNDDSATLESRIKETICKVILCDINAVDKCKEAVKNVEWSVEIITTENHPDCLSIEKILEIDDGKDCPPLEISGEDPALVLCTSGTTGLPKGAVLTHAALVKHLHEITFMPFSSTKPNALFSTATHYTGSMLTLAMLACGKTAILTGKITKELFWKTIHDMKPGNAFAFPTYLMSLVTDEAKEYDFSSLDYLTTGGAMVTPAIKKALLKLQNVKDIVNAYGLSECGITLTNAVLKENPESCTYMDCPDTAIGRPKPGTLIQIRDIDTLEPLGPNKNGEICIHNTTLFHSYLNNPEATKSTFIDGYLRTGDIGYYDEKHFIHIVDRLKEIFKYYGSHISPSEVENVISQHEMVNEVCVVGVPDPDAGEIPRAFVTVKENTSHTLKDEILEFAHAKLPTYKHLRGGLHIVPELPKGNTGKITRSLVAKLEV